MDVYSLLRLDDAALFSQCKLERVRAGGPGGQRRNKVETGVRLRHSVTGIEVRAVDDRSQEANRKAATRRLRERIALECRSALDPDAPNLPLELVKHRTADKGLRISHANADYPIVVAAILDALSATGKRYAAAAKVLGVTTSQLVRFVEQDRNVARALSELPQ